MSIGREDYNDRREERAERLEERASKARAESHAAFQVAHEIGSRIPMGQPILVGHHSEKHHRRDLDKIHRNMRKSVDAGKKADYYEQRAETARSNSAISSDDPDAVEKLEAKLAAYQAAQERDKALNAWYRKHKTMKGFPGVTDEEAARADAELAEMREGIRRPVPAWQLSNRNGEISRLKKRLESLRSVDEMEHVEIEFDGGVIVTNEDVNRVQILFDAKPDEDTRAKLKSCGFHWSPKEGAWQTLRNPRNLRRACYALGIDTPNPKKDPEPDAESAPATGPDEGDAAHDAAAAATPGPEEISDELRAAADGQVLFPA